MSRISTLLARMTVAVMLGSVLLLAGCHRGEVKKEQQLAASTKGQFDLVMKAYKDGQFLLDGAVLSALDAGSHFAYLRDQGRLPKKVLLIDSDDSKVRKKHLQYMARMSIDYGFHAYFFNGKGQLTEISPVDVKARKLEDSHKRAPVSNESRSSDASGRPYDSSQH
ncbi:MAG: hypothetical protein EPN69_09605 [Rhodanobacter sp.]|nr:MAG: hypothetical protein EPN69_09605 [Rhodanobacter sp.]TAL95813.1 MAG: hypothetical protein EPN71_09730 [Rhodanobacter sp.]TAM42587.1 MAG: hypothetical protein EPN58_02930 [Rhodanobacter sp.]TAN26244.1 MAG: hypothetical protein EPN32_08130 [Rhodanobacter sp.]